jgi:hypothetical protein
MLCFLAQTQFYKLHIKTNRVENHDFIQVSHVFQPFLNDISAICWPIWMQNIVLERLLVVDYMTEIWI